MLLSLRILPFLVFILVIVFYAFNLVVFPDEPILRHSSWSESSTSSHAAMNRTLGVRNLSVSDIQSFALTLGHLCSFKNCLSLIYLREQTVEMQ